MLDPRRGNPPEDLRSRLRGALDLERAAECLESISHPAESRPVSPRRRIEPDAVVAYLEDDLAILPPEPDVDVRGTRVLRDVVEGLEHAEVDAGLDVPVEPTDTVCLDRDRNGCLAALRLERRGESLVG
jgi:hypothetical protein